MTCSSRDLPRGPPRDTLSPSLLTPRMLSQVREVLQQGGAAAQEALQQARTVAEPQIAQARALADKQAQNLAKVWPCTLFWEA